MKQFKLIALLGAVLMLSGCGTGYSEIEETLVIKEVVVNNKPKDDCETCALEDRYKYKMTISSSNGEAYFYSDVKHEVGDTLLSSKMFVQQEVDDRAELKNEVKYLQKENDSLKEANITMQFQYDLMLQFFESKIIPEEIEKSKQNSNFNK